MEDSVQPVEQWRECDEGDSGCLVAPDGEHRLPQGKPLPEGQGLGMMQSEQAGSWRELLDAIVPDVKALVEGVPYDHERVIIRRLHDALEGTPTKWVSHTELRQQAAITAAKAALETIVGCQKYEDSAAMSTVVSVAGAALTQLRAIEGAQ